MDRTIPVVELATPNKCTGCSACFAACCFGSLKMVSNERGFQRPHIDSNQCVDCGACSRACPVVGSLTQCNEPARRLAAWDVDPRRRSQASSGGIFMLLADAVLARGGWVCGAVLDSDMVVHHVVSRNRDTVESMRGSKYVQSRVAEALTECLELLQEGDEVLFSGVPCQVDAMRRLAEDRLSDRLLLVDVLCHGAPSPRFWRAYLDYREREADDKVIAVRFRKKEPSWTVFSLELMFKTKHRLHAWCTYDDFYLRAFLGDYITQEACHKCSYCGTSRVSDVTLADFWGYVSETWEDRNTEEGISLVLVNTDKGAIAFDALEGIHFVEKQLPEAVKGNPPLRTAFPPNPNADEFWRRFEAGGVDAVKDIYLYRVVASRKHRLSLWFNDHAYLFPRYVRNALLGLRRYF